MINQSTNPGLIQQALRQLDDFVGNWHTTGMLTASSATPALTIEGTDTYEWVSGGLFLLHKVDVKIGGARNETTELIGYDPHSGTYPMYYFDNKGTAGTMHAHFDNGTWTFLGDSLRFSGGFSKEGTKLTGNWEIMEGITWKHLMTIELNKAAI